MYHWFNKQHFVAECCFICSTNLSLSWHHSLQGVCCSSISAGSDTIPGSTSLSLWLDGLARRGSIEIKIFYRTTWTYKIQTQFLFITHMKQFRRLLVLMKRAACSTEHPYNSLVFYNLHHSKGESRWSRIRSGHTAEYSHPLFRPGNAVRIQFYRPRFAMVGLQLHN